MDVKAPKNEIAMVSYVSCDGVPMFLLTTKQTREFYFLYEITNGNLTKLGKAKSPKELEEKFMINQRLRESTLVSLEELC